MQKKRRWDWTVKFSDIKFRRIGPITWERIIIIKLK